MSQLYYDLLYASIFIVTLLAVMRFRRSALASDRRAYHNMTIGLSLFIAFSMVQMGAHAGLFTGVPYLGDPLGQKMVEAAAIVGGLLFLMAGIGALLPSMIRGGEKRQRLNKRYFCLKMITQTMGKNNNLDETYYAVAQFLTSYLGMARCSAHKYSSKKDTLYLAGAAGFETRYPEAIRRLPISRLRFREALSRLQPTDYREEVSDRESNDRPDIIVPIAGGSRLYGALFCWKKAPSAADDDLLDFLATVGQSLGRYTSQLVLETKKGYHDFQQKMYERLNDVCNQVGSVTELVPRLFQVFGEVNRTEYLSIAALDSSGENMVRYTMGAGGRLLLEKGVSRQTRGTDIFTVYSDGNPIISSEVIATDQTGEQDGLFLSCGMRSKLVCPVKVGKKVVAVMTLGHTRPGHFTRHDLHRVSGMADMIAGVLQREQLRHGLEIREDHMLRLQVMEGQLSDNASVQTYFHDACDLLTRRMRCTIARISLVDNDRQHLISQACRTIRDTGQQLREMDAIPLSLLPWHRMALEARKLMLINQEDPQSRMQPQESASILLPGIKSAMLVPITLNDKVKGVVSIGEARNWNRRAFGATDLIFAKDVAGKCSVALRMRQLEIEAEKTRLRPISVLDESSLLTEMRSRLKSPLTSIIGAVELLRLKGATDEFASKYHDLILRSADRIKVLTDEEMAPEAAEEVLSEEVVG